MKSFKLFYLTNCFFIRLHFVPTGGLNTPLHNSDFSGVVPSSNAVVTPNTILATPFRSQRSDGTPIASFNTPGSVRTQNGVLAPTPIRDKLNINSEDALEGSETPGLKKQVEI